jgi:hypothetical protein
MAAVFTRMQGRVEIVARDRAIKEISSVIKVDTSATHKVSGHRRIPEGSGHGKSSSRDQSRHEKAD